MSKWISVKDELPPIRKQVLAFEDYGNGRIIQVSRTKEHQDNWEYIIDSTGYIETPRYTHWMKLPEKPRKIK